ncbi:hypothetical protein G6F31_020825 [Rhizopus arrhizus]|nr:hypothetical protein G6F31_020825 [Rhizopus arrhizus]
MGHQPRYLRLRPHLPPHEGFRLPQRRLAGGAQRRRHRAVPAGQRPGCGAGACRPAACRHAAPARDRQQ